MKRHQNKVTKRNQFFPISGHANSIEIPTEKYCRCYAMHPTGKAKHLKAFVACPKLTWWVLADGAVSPSDYISHCQGPPV